MRWHRTTVAGRRVVYAETGSGAPLVFLHGWGLSARAYAPALRALTRAGARVIAPGLPGFGRSDPLPDPLTWSALADWVVALLDHIGVSEPVFVVGHSFGGGVATATAYHHTDRVRSLVLVNSVGGAVWRADGAAPRGLEERPWWDWGLHLPTEFVGRYRRVFPVVARDFLANALTHPAAMLRAGLLARQADLREELAAITARGVPVTILWGDKDRVLPEAAHVALCTAAGAEGDVLRDAGHSWLLADPDGFAEVLTNSLTIHALLSRRRAT